MKHTIDFPDDLYEALKALAEREHRSVNSEVVHIVKEVVEAIEGLGLTAITEQPPPLDAQGIPPGSVKGKATGYERALRQGLDDVKDERDRRATKPPCTCGPGEKAKGKHNKKCPAKGA